MRRLGLYLLSILLALMLLSLGLSHWRGVLWQLGRTQISLSNGEWMYWWSDVPDDVDVVVFDARKDPLTAKAVEQEMGPLKFKMVGFAYGKYVSAGRIKHTIIIIPFWPAVLAVALMVWRMRPRKSSKGGFEVLTTTMIS